MKRTGVLATPRAAVNFSEWNGLCRVGAAAALILTFYSLATIVQVVALGGQPGTAGEAFRLLQEHRIVGLLRLDLPTLLVLPLYYLVFLGLFAVLYRPNKTQALLAITFAFVGVTLLLATPGALSMLSLSERYASATTEAAMSQLLAAGEAILASDIWHGTGAIMGGILTQCGGVLICTAMLRGRVFGRITAYLGLVMFALDLVHIIVAPFVPVAGFFFMAAAGPLYPIWFFLVGKRLFQMGKTGGDGSTFTNC